MGCVESKRRSFNATKYRDRSLNESRIFNPADRSMSEIKRGKLQQLPKKKLTINIEQGEKQTSHGRKIETPQSNLGVKLNQVLQAFPPNLKMSSVDQENKHKTYRVDSQYNHKHSGIEQLRNLKMQSVDYESKRRPNKLESNFRHKPSGFEDLRRKTSQFEQSKQKPNPLSSSKASEPQNLLYYHSLQKPINHSLSSGQLMQDYIVQQRKMINQEIDSVNHKKIQDIDINIKLQPPSQFKEADRSPQRKGFNTSAETESTNEKQPIRFKMEQLVPASSQRRPHTTKVIYHKEYFSKTEVRN